MYLERKQDLSIYYWLKDDIFSDAPFINIKDGFPTEGLSLPTVAVEGSDISIGPFELGNPYGIKYRIWDIDVFGENKSQRDEYAYRILNEVENKIPVYDYDEGFPPDVTPTKLGILIPERIKMEIIRVDPNLVSTLYWRATISFVAIYEQN